MTTEQKVSPGTKRAAKSKGDHGGKKAKREDTKEKEEKTVKPVGQRPKNSKRRSVASKVSYKEESNSEAEERLSDEEEFQVTSEEDSDDFESEAKSSKNGKAKSKVKNNRKTAATEKNVKEKLVKEKEEEEGNEGGEASKRRSGKKTGSGADEWLEVYLDKTASWVCVDVEHGVGVPKLCSQNATAPVTYVVSVDGDGFLKDLGKKYDPTWMTSSRKRRVDDEWWEETLAPFLGPEDERDKKEEKEVRQTLL